jgi:hypothetical protein
MSYTHITVRLSNLLLEALDANVESFKQRLAIRFWPNAQGTSSHLCHGRKSGIEQFVAHLMIAWLFLHHLLEQI